MPVDAPAAPEVKTPAVPAAVPPAVPDAKAAEPQKEVESLLGGAKADPAAKPADAKAGDKKEDAKPQGAPEKYADFKLPEGLTLDKELGEKFSTTAKKLGLSQESAQELVTLQADHAAATLKAGLQSWENTKTEWRKETISGLGANYEKELSYAAKALDSFGGPELRKLLSETGLGENIHFAKAFIAIGRRMAEPGHLEGDRAGGAGSSLEDTKRSMFPSMYNTDGTQKK